MDGSRARFRIRIAALFAAVAWVVCGCAAPRNHLYRWDGDEFERAFVLPLNLVVSMPRELRGTGGRVQAALVGYLAERGKSVQTMSVAEATAAWRASDEECRSQGRDDCDRFEGVARVMAQRLRRDHDYTTLIIPYVLLRSARCRWATALWDGVERPVEATGEGFGPDGPIKIVRGEIRAASLKVFAFSVDGEKVFEGIGGLDLVDRVHAPEGPETLTYEMREDVLADPQQLREGVELALERLVPRSDAS